MSHMDYNIFKTFKIVLTHLKNKKRIRWPNNGLSNFCFVFKCLAGACPGKLFFLILGGGVPGLIWSPMEPNWAEKQPNWAQMELSGAQMEPSGAQIASHPGGGLEKRASI